jgi:peptide/nickel transport system permease protein
MNKLTAVGSAPPIDRPRRRRTLGVRRFFSDPKAVFAVLVLGTFAIGALGAPILAPYGENDQDPSRSLQAPSLKHPMGTDRLGRDLLSRVIYGARTSVTVGLVAVSVATLIGVPLGLVAGTFGGAVDNVLMRFVDAWIAFPTLILIMSIVAIMGGGVVSVMIAIGLGSYPVYARLIRGQTLSIKEREFVLSARALGAGETRIMVRHILPNAVQPVIVQASLLVGVAVLAEASLSFLGIGVRPPAATWGIIMSEGFPLIRVSPWPVVFPGIAIFLFVLATNFLGDRLRDTLDPRRRGR